MILTLSGDSKSADGDLRPVLDEMPDRLGQRHELVFNFRMNAHSLDSFIFYREQTIGALGPVLLPLIHHVST